MGHGCPIPIRAPADKSSKSNQYRKKALPQRALQIGPAPVFAPRRTRAQSKYPDSGARSRPFPHPPFCSGCPRYFYEKKTLRSASPVFALSVIHNPCASPANTLCRTDKRDGTPYKTVFSSLRCTFGRVSTHTRSEIRIPHMRSTKGSPPKGFLSSAGILRMLQIIRQRSALERADRCAVHNILLQEHIKRDRGNQTHYYHRTQPRPVRFVHQVLVDFKHFNGYGIFFALSGQQ